MTKQEVMHCDTKHNLVKSGPICLCALTNNFQGRLKKQMFVHLIYYLFVTHFILHAHTHRHTHAHTTHFSYL
jgi:hypothetical protein